MISGFFFLLTNNRLIKHTAVPHVVIFLEECIIFDRSLLKFQVNAAAINTDNTSDSADYEKNRKIKKIQDKTGSKKQANTLREQMYCTISAP